MGGGEGGGEEGGEVVEGGFVVVKGAEGFEGFVEGGHCFVLLADWLMYKLVSWVWLLFRFNAIVLKCLLLLFDLSTEGARSLGSSRLTVSIRGELVHS